MDKSFCVDNCLYHPVKLSDVDVQNIDWMSTTNGFKYISVSNVINAIGIINEEKRSLIEILCKAARENNITLEPDVIGLMEQKYMFYGGSKETFSVIARMKKKSVSKKNSDGVTTQEDDLKYIDEIECIKSLTLEKIYNTSPKALKELTNDFSEPLIRLLMMKAKTIGEQKGLLKYIKKAYAIWQKKTKILWSEHPAVGGYPEYFDTMEANIDSDRYITTSGSVPVGSNEYYQLMSQQKENLSSRLYSKDMLNAAVAALKAQIPHFVYDQPNEGLSIVYGENKKKVNLDEVIEKKAKDVVNKQLEEINATDADIDEIFADMYGQDLDDKVNQELAEEEDTEEIEGEENFEEDEVQDEWDDSYDGVFKEELNPQTIFNKLENMTYTRVTDDYPRIFVYFKVLLYLGWIENHQKNFLRWANCHWGFDWKYDYNFKFGNNIKKELRDTEMSDWNDKTCNGSDIGKAYRSLANKVLDVLAEKVNDGKIIDRMEFYKKGVKNRINDGKKLEYPF